MTDKPVVLELTMAEGLAVLGGLYGYIEMRRKDKNPDDAILAAAYDHIWAEMDTLGRTQIDEFRRARNLVNLPYHPRGGDSDA